MSKFGLHPAGHDTCVVKIDHTKNDIYALSYERVTRKKHDDRFPKQILRRMLEAEEHAEIIVPIKDELNGSTIKFYDSKFNYLNSRLTLGRINNKREYLYFKNIFLLFKIFRFFFFDRKNLHIKNLNSFKKQVLRQLKNNNITIKFVDHHLSHACSAYYFAPSNFKDSSLVITLDGQGDGAFCKVYTVKQNRLHEEVYSEPSSSIPLLFTIATKAIGFTPNSDEGKLEALAAFDNLARENPVFKILEKSFYFDEYLKIRLNKSIEFPFDNISLSYDDIFNYFLSLQKIHSSAVVAGGVQKFFEDFFVKYIAEAQKRFSLKNACFAGGGFANVKLNRQIFEQKIFENIYIFPAMGDDGAALGALIQDDFESGVNIEWVRSLTMPFFGDEFSRDEVKKTLLKNSTKVKFTDLNNEYHKFIAEDLAKGLICAHFKSRMEFGPRALGNRSILANPLIKTITSDLNLKFKKREAFQPFCPSILDEEADKLFDSYYLNRHMTSAFTVKRKYVDKIPGIVHIDGTARAQFVNENTNFDLYTILQKFKSITGYGALINTSFNIHGKTIVRTPQDAIDDFIDCRIDVMYIEGFRVSRID